MELSWQKMYDLVKIYYNNYSNSEIKKVLNLKIELFEQNIEELRNKILKLKDKLGYGFVYEII